MAEELPLFSYGTLREAETQLELFGRRIAGASDSLPGFLLEDIEVTERDGRVWSHFIAVRTGRETDRIAGVALELSANELAVCDGYEPEPYVRREVTLASGVRAWTYVHREKA